MKMISATHTGIYSAHTYLQVVTKHFVSSVCKLLSSSFVVLAFLSTCMKDLLKAEAVMLWRQAYDYPCD